MNMRKDLVPRFETAVYYVLTTITAVYILLQVVELIYQFGLAIITPDDSSERLLISQGQLARVLPVFFNVLIAVELIDTFKSYIKEHRIKAQSILLIGLIAVGRKLLVVDFGHADGPQNVGLASIILALSVGYYLVRRNPGSDSGSAA